MKGILYIHGICLTMLLFINVPRGLASKDSGLTKLYSRIEEAAINGNQSIQEQLLMKAVMLCLDLHKIEEADSLCNQAYAINRLQNNDSLLAEYHQHKGIIFIYKLRPDSALKHLNIALRLFTKQSNVYAITRVKLNTANLYYRQGLQDRALKIYLKVLNSNESVVKENFLNNPTIYNSTGMAYFYAGNFDKATFYLNKALETALKKDDAYSLALIYNNLALIYTKQKNQQMLHQTLMRSLEIAQENNFSNIESNVYNNLGNYYVEEGKEDLAFDYFLKGLGSIPSDAISKQKVSALFSIILHLPRQNQVLQNKVLEQLGYKSLLDLLLGFEKQIADKDYTNKVEIYSYLYLYFLGQKDYKQALFYNKKFNALKDTLDNSVRAREIAKLEFKYALERQEQETALLVSNMEKEKVMIKARNRLIIAVLIIVLMTVVLIISRKNEKNKKAKLIAQKELQLKEQELKHYIQSLIDKNRFIEELEDKYANREIEDELKLESKIKELSKLKILTEEDWVIFQELFNEVYPHFIWKLEKEFSSLTEAEKRQFILIKLGFSNKQNAGMLGISTESVIKNRYRLKKKLHLDNDTDLNDFVAHFS